jgi:hypothetical protein
MMCAEEHVTKNLEPGGYFVGGAYAQAVSATVSDAIAKNLNLWLVISW